MEQITIGVDNSSNSGILLSLLKNLPFVKWIEKGKTIHHAKLPPAKFKNKKDFWETFGSGKNSAINIQHIRENAWRKNKL